MKVTVSVEGLKAVDAALGELPKATGKNVLRRTGRKVLQPFDESWRSKVRERTGQLKKSGGVGSKLTRSQRAAVERESFVEVYAGPGPEPQGITEEFGTFQQAAHPYVRPAWDEKKDAIPAAVGTELWPEIEKAAKRLAKKRAKGG